MKNQKIMMLSVVVLILIISAFFYAKPKNKSNETKNVFTSIKDVLSKDVSLTCDFKDDNGASTKSYIKNGAVRVSTTGQSSQAEEIILKDKKMYMWDVKTKQGFVYNVPAEETNTNIDQSKSYLNMLNKYKDSCKVEAVSDSYFTVPSDIKFQDMTKLLDDLKKQMPKAPLPTQ